MKPKSLRCPECAAGIECVDHWVQRADHVGERLSGGVEPDPEEDEESAIDLLEES